MEYKCPVCRTKAQSFTVYDYNNYILIKGTKGLRTYTYGEYTVEYTPTDALLPASSGLTTKVGTVMDITEITSFLDMELLKDHHLFQLMFLKAEERKSRWTNGERKFDFYAVVNLIMVVQPTS